MRTLLKSLAVAAVCFIAPGAQAQTVIDEWSTAKFPPAPVLKLTPAREVRRAQ